MPAFPTPYAKADQIVTGFFNVSIVLLSALGGQCGVLSS